MLEPVIATEKYNAVDINIKTSGGGYSGQAQAIKQAIGMAFINDDPENRYSIHLFVSLSSSLSEKLGVHLKCKKNEKASHHYNAFKNGINMAKYREK